jgi:hypothetical protein
MKGGAAMQKKDYSRYYDPIFEEVCDRAEALARAEGEDREGVLSVIRHPSWAGPPLPPLDKYVPWAKEMRARAAAQMKAEQKVEQEAANPEGELYPKDCGEKREDFGDMTLFPGSSENRDRVTEFRHQRYGRPGTIAEKRIPRCTRARRHLIFAA